MGGAAAGADKGSMGLGLLPAPRSNLDQILTERHLLRSGLKTHVIRFCLGILDGDFAYKYPGWRFCLYISWMEIGDAKRLDSRDNLVLLFTKN